MKNWAFIGLLLSAGAIADPSKGIAMSISIHNLTEKSIVVWINGVREIIEYESAVTAPCLPNESIEIQVRDSIKKISCGSSLGVMP